MLATMVGQRQKILKFHWIKGLKTVPNDEIWIRKYMIKNFVFGVYLLISDFLKVSKPTKASLKTFHSFYKPQLIQHYKKYTPSNTAYIYIYIYIYIRIRYIYIYMYNIYYIYFQLLFSIRYFYQ